MSRSTGKNFTGIKDKKIRIFEKRSGEKDSQGFSKEIYFDFFGMALWANYRSISGNDFVVYNIVYGYECEALFTINWHKGIRTGMYVLFRDKAYEIVYVDDLEGYKANIKLHCKSASGFNADDLMELLESTTTT